MPFHLENDSTGICGPLQGWPQPEGVSVYSDVSSDIATAPLFTQTWANADGYLIPTGNYTGVSISNDVRSFVPLRGVFPVKKGQFIALQGTGVHSGKLQTDIWPTEKTEEDSLMLAAYAITAPSSDTLINIYDWMSNRDIGDVSVGAADTLNTQTITEATWKAVGSQVQAQGLQVYTSGGSVASDANIRIRYGGVIVYQAILGAGAPRGSLAGFEGGQHPSSNSGDITIECAALGPGVVSTMNYWFKVRA